MPQDTLRAATADDIPLLVAHRSAMFAEIAALRGRGYPPEDYEHLDQSYGRYLREQLGAGSLAWVIERDGAAAASGAVSFIPWLPGIGNRSGAVAYLHSIYTEPDQRRRGLARRLVETAAQECRARGHRALSLHASPEGRPLYEQLGFLATNEMRLILEP
jgi:GNAT superfamily N-acetyltransferase